MRLQELTTIKTPTAILLSVGCLLLWLPDLLGASQTASLPLLKLPIAVSVALPTWLATLLTLIATIGNGLLLSLLIFHIGWSRTLSFLPLFLYVVTCTLLPETHLFLGEQLGLAPCLSMLLLLTDMWKNRVAVEQAFLCGLLLPVACVFTPDYAWLLPILWIAFAWLRAWSLRVLLANILGVLAAVIMAVCCAVLFKGDCPIPDEQIWLTRQWGFLLPLRLSLIHFAAMVLIGFTCIGGYVVNSFHDSTHTRANMSAFSTFWIISLASTIAPGPSGVHALFGALTACLFTHYLLSRKSNFRSVLYLSYLTIMLLHYSYFWITQ